MGDEPKTEPSRLSGTGWVGPTQLPDAGRQSAVPTEKKTRTWDPREWEEDQRFVDAMDLVAKGYKREALSRLLQLYKDDSSHLYGRLQAFNLALELKVSEVAAEHAEWAIQFNAQHMSTKLAADAYREARLALPDMKWSERALVTALISGDKAKDRRVVVDATKMLLLMYPQSPALPRAFIASADVQLAEGRPDLAARTLANVIARFPMDGLVPLAQRKLKEVQEGAAPGASTASKPPEGPTGSR